MDTPSEADQELLPTPFDVHSVEQRTTAELDLLPFGVIGLDADGRVTSYNLAESRLARLDRAQVLGRNFFREVAPCTATDEFEGRIQRFLVTGGATTSRFPYLFDFQFGAQEVEVEVVRARAGGAFLIVNRRKFAPARRGLPAGFAAPLQRELAPDEPRDGVLRDAQERRVVRVTPPFFASLRAAWRRVAPEGWALFCYEWGTAWGRLAIVDLEVEALEATERSLSQLPLGDVAARVAAWLRREGWGDLQLDLAHAREGVVVAHFVRSALAESLGASDGGQCQLLAGMLRAMLSHLAGKMLIAREVVCACDGGPRCDIVIVGQARRGALETALAQQPRTLPGVIAALARRAT